MTNQPKSTTGETPAADQHWYKCLTCGKEWHGDPMTHCICTQPAPPPTQAEAKIKCPKCGRSEYGDVPYCGVMAYHCNACGHNWSQRPAASVPPPTQAAMPTEEDETSAAGILNSLNLPVDESNLDTLMPIMAEMRQRADAAEAKLAELRGALEERDRRRNEIGRNEIYTALVIDGGFVNAARTALASTRPSQASGGDGWGCPGCGLPELHKMCPRWGTDVYMNREHPDWGKPLLPAPDAAKGGG